MYYYKEMEFLTKVQLKQIAKQIHEMENERKKVKEAKQDTKRLAKVYDDYHKKKKDAYHDLIKEMVSIMINPDFRNIEEDGLDEYCYISLAYHIDNKFYMTVLDTVEHLNCLIKEI